MAFFKDGFQKLMKTVKASDAGESAGYRGHLSSTQLRLCEGNLLGPDSANPQTLTSWNSLIAFSTSAGHIRILGQEMDCTIRNPAAPVAPAFLLFCRSGLLLSIGLADAASPMAGGRATWIAQWWDFKPEIGSMEAAHQALMLRFGVSCVAAAEDASLVFLGTDEGDVRVFDASSEPHLASYCVPCTAIYGRKDRPCPVAAVGVCPAASDVIIANGEGGLLLWSFEKHRSVRSFDSMSGVTSVLWCLSGSHFLAATRSDISVFSRSSSTALARLTLPGGSSQGVSLLRWDGQMTPESSQLSGDLWLRRGAPDPSLQRLTGENWSRSEDVMHDVLGATAFRSTSLQTKPCGCPAMPSLFGETYDLDLPEVSMVVLQNSGGLGRFMVATAGKTYPLTWGSLPLANFSCMELYPSKVLQAQPLERSTTPPVSRFWAVCNGELKDAVSMPPTDFIPPDDGWFVCSSPESPDEPEALQWQLPSEPRSQIQGEISLGLDAKVELRLGSVLLHLDVASQQASWSDETMELDLAPGISHFLKIRLEPEDAGYRIEVQLDDISLPKAIQEVSVSEVEWRCLEGELRLRELFLEGVSEEKSEVVSNEMQLAGSDPLKWVEEMFALHLAHFHSFLEGKEVEASPQAFAATWSILSGGLQGLLATGHADGTIRLWLRSASSLLLLHVLSLQPCNESLPWRPLLRPGGEGEGPNWSHYDGIDACPVFFAGEMNEKQKGISQIALETTVGALAAGCMSGEIAVFLWQSAPSNFTASEVAEWRVQMLLSQENKSSTADHLDLPQLPSGFVCAMRLRQHLFEISLLKLVHSAERSAKLLLFSCDSSSQVSICDCLTGEMLCALSMAQSSLGSPGGPGPPPETLEAVAFSGSIVQVASADGKMPLPAVPGDFASTPCGAFVLALSSGELRQMAGPDFKLLDSRIRETRLPRLSGGKFLLLHLCDSFLLAVQATTCSVFLREDRLQPTAQNVKFSKRAIAAEICEVAGELCLYSLMTSGSIEIWALPSLHQVATLPVTGMTGDGAVICSDGSLAITAPKGGGLWLTSAGDTCERVALESSVRSAHLAQVIQGLQKSDEGESGKVPTPSSSGMFGALFGREVKTLRSCLSSCPSDFDGDRLDQSRGLCPAASKFNSRPPPPPPPAAASSSAPAAPASRGSRAGAVAGLRDELAETTNRALERGEKMSNLANRSQRMADDADQFYALAKQLNARQNRWF